MTDRDRLIELLKGAETKVAEALTRPLELEEWLSIYADYLLANGVIVPPCKVGDKVYTVGVFTGQIISCEVVSIISTENDCFLHLENETVVCVSQQLGKTVSLTKEEAEAKIKEREGK